MSLIASFSSFSSDLVARRGCGGMLSGSGRRRKEVDGALSCQVGSLRDTILQKHCKHLPLVNLAGIVRLSRAPGETADARWGEATVQGVDSLKDFLASSVSVTLNEREHSSLA